MQTRMILCELHIPIKTIGTTYEINEKREIGDSVL
jgi:hypothetical protein